MTPHHTKSRILLATDVPFWRAEAGAHRRIATLVCALCEAGHPVCVYYVNLLKPGDRAHCQNLAPGITLAHPPLPLLFLRAFRRRLGIRFHHESQGAPIAWERCVGLRRLCRRWRPAFVIIEYLWSAYLIEGLRESLDDPPQLLIDTIDVMHLRAARFEEQGYDGVRVITREEEATILARFDVLLAIQAREAEALRAMCPDKPILITGHAHTVYPPRYRETGVVRLLFVGAGGAHNRTAILAFLGEVWPRLRARHGQTVELHIAGAICEALRGNPLPSGVVLHGFVDELETLYGEADIAVNPVFAGSGLKIKNVEALCHGLPLVTTSVGAEGLEAGMSTAFLVGDSHELLAEALDTLIISHDARRELAKNAHVFARDYLGPRAAYGDLLGYLAH